MAKKKEEENKEEVGEKIKGYDTYKHYLLQTLDFMTACVYTSIMYDLQVRLTQKILFRRPISGFYQNFLHYPRLVYTF
jgi:hypothetical protein